MSSEWVGLGSGGPGASRTQTRTQMVVARHPRTDRKDPERDQGKEKRNPKELTVDAEWHTYSENKQESQESEVG